MKNNNVKILWLSDIHYKDAYENDDKAKKIFNDFFKFLEKHGSEISYVIFSGDLTFDSQHDSYSAFKDNVFTRIREILPNSVKFISVPGNHDVLWDEVEKVYDKDVSKAFTFFKRDDKKVNPDKYLPIFKNFKSRDNPLKGVTFPIGFNRKEDDFVKINNNGWYGYYYDSSLNYLFILINSAWLSFGLVPKRKVFGNIETDMVFNGVKDTITKMIAVKNEILVEQGNQTYAFHLFNNYIEEIETIINEKEPMVISVAHHPPSWLGWFETHSKSHKNPPALSQLAKISKLHLVGHEHTAPNFGTILGGTCLMLDSGMFLDDSIEKEGEEHLLNESYYPNNWFSILNISQNRLEQNCYNYFHEGNNDFLWKNEKSFFYQYNNDGSIRFGDNFTNQKLNISNEEGNTINVDSEERNAVVSHDVNKPKDFDFLMHLKKKSTSNNFEVSLEFKDKHDFLNFDVFVDTQDKKIRFFINSIKDNLINNEIRTTLIDYLAFALEKHSGMKEIIISIVDFFTIKNNFFENQIDIGSGEFDLFYQKKNIEFNSFKHKFFVLLEETNISLFKKLHDVKFTYDLVMT